MSLQVGTYLGAYEIVAPLGKGGMGEVYRARDSRLKRDVAIKVLPAEFCRDAERVSRFEREAQLLASLNHPHIAGIYDVSNLEQSRFLVLELIEGETLADRIASVPVSMNESLAIAKQIAEALEAAHEKGIIHRDLKPANIKLTPGGGKWQISSESGQGIAWSPKGNELFYRAGAKMMVVAIQTQPTFSAGKPQLLFETPQACVQPFGGVGADYSVSLDGQRFLMARARAQAQRSLTQINVVTNWFEELKRIVPSH